MKYLDNDYTRLYFKLINHRLINPPPDGIKTEVHHIVPRSLGGMNHKTNLVKLTLLEHLTCHLLLPDMVLSHDHITKMEFALAYMLSLGSNSGLNFNLEAYTLAKIINKKANIAMWTAERRDLQRQKRLGSKDTENTKQRKREAAKHKPKPSIETINKRAKANTGQTRTAQTKKNISEAKKNPSGETRKRLSDAAKERERLNALKPKKEISIEERLRRSNAAKERERIKRLTAPHPAVRAIARAP